MSKIGEKLIMNTEAKLEPAHAGVTFPPPFIYLIAVLLGAVPEFFYPIPLIESYYRYLAGGC